MLYGIVAVAIGLIIGLIIIKVKMKYGEYRLKLNFRIRFIKRLYAPYLRQITLQCVKHCFKNFPRYETPLHFIKS